MRKSMRKIIAIASASVMALTFAVTSAPNASAGTISKAAKEAAKAAFDASGKTTYHAYSRQSLGSSVMNGIRKRMV